MEQAIPLVITAVVAYLLGVWRERERTDRKVSRLGAEERASVESA